MGDFSAQAWDVLSNKEVMDIVASAPTHGTAARALVDCAVRSWRIKFLASKIDDCAAVCLFLDFPSSRHKPQKNDSKESPKEPAEQISLGSTLQDDTNKEEVDESVSIGAQTFDSLSTHACILLDTNDIVPVSEEPKEDKVPERSKFTRSLADCISNSEEEEWSALEGITRVNSLLNLPRFLSGDKWSTTRRKWS